jgi:hypothetical protein
VDTNQCIRSMTTKYKCHVCHTIVPSVPCPVCGSSDGVEEMCELDRCGCNHEIVHGLAYCPKCKRAMCPVCGCHDVAQVSRVTGYLADVGGWNAAKAQELKDRKRTQL